VLSKKIHWDRYELEYILDHGWKIMEDGKIELSREQFEKHQYSGLSCTIPGVKTMMLPSIQGWCLIFEGNHFIIV